MKKYFLFLFISILSVSLFQCNESTTQTSKLDLPISIIPQPENVEKKMGHFTLEKNTKIILPSSEKEWQWVGNHLSEKINSVTDFGISISEEKGESNITFENSNSITHDEGYELSVDPYEVIIRAKTPQGAFHGVQSLLQLFPKEIFAAKKTENISWVIPATKISDQPRFSYRGMHFDVARHFFGVQDVKKFIDLLAIHKMNTMHWHLTDDQGWRIEIKKYPKLTEIGGFRNGTLIGHYNDQPHKFDDKRYGGFYTQDEIKEVVQYAAERFITVIPEIDLPGHAQAALSAYPELGVTGKPMEAMKKWGVSENIFSPSEETFEFLENVLEEVIALFPSKYIHVGGDECPKVQWEESKFCQEVMKREGLKDGHELQSYYIQRIEKFINSKGRQIIGWDEILEGGLAPNATVMSWTGIQGGIEAAKSGHDAIMTPTSHCYFDYYQSDHPDEPLAIGGFIPLKKVYDYEPIPEELTEEEGKHILGTQGNIWTEYIPTFDKLEYMIYPRACALAETGWSPKAKKDFPDFISRLSLHLKRFELMGVNAANHLYELKSSIQPNGKNTEVSLETLAKDAKIFYTLDGSQPSLNSSLYKSPIVVSKNENIKAQAFLDDTKVGRGWEQNLEMHKAAGKSISLKNNPHPKYAGGGNGSIINGVKGSNERYGDAEWLGFGDGTDFEATIDLGKEESITKLGFRFFKGEGQWIYLPKSIQVFASNDGEDFKEVAMQKNIEGNTKVVNIEIPVKEVNSKFIKIVAKNYGKIPKGNQGAGQLAWLFIDEISVN